ASDGQRVLVDRLWPRGLAKARAGIDLWLKEVAPSTALRRWYGHDPARREAVRQRDRPELEAHPALGALRAQSRQGPTTLAEAARWEACRQRYRSELEAHPALDALRAQARQGTIPLVYAARDAQHTHALVLRELLEQGD